MLTCTQGEQREFGLVTLVCANTPTAQTHRWFGMLLTALQLCFCALMRSEIFFFKTVLGGTERDFENKEGTALFSDVAVFTLA